MKYSCRHIGAYLGKIQCVSDKDSEQLRRSGVSPSDERISLNSEICEYYMTVAYVPFSWKCASCRRMDEQSIVPPARGE